jgi:CRISPR/Cas system-associated exonuclease Cas4 (RecB family)
MYNNTQITSWSFSRLAEYLSCPYKAKLKFVDKLKEPESPAFAHGTAVHKGIEIRIMNLTQKIGYPTASIAQAIIAEASQAYKAGTGKVEESWNFKKDWTETEWNDWNGCFLRVKIDFFNKVNNVAEVIDWKTGKYREYTVEDYKMQLKLYALATFKKYPEVDRVEAKLVFVEGDGHIEAMTFERDQLVVLLAYFGGMVDTMVKDKTFEPKASWKCKWCHWRKENGGSCKY